MNVIDDKLPWQLHFETLAIEYRPRTESTSCKDDETLKCNLAVLQLPALAKVGKVRGARRISPNSYDSIALSNVLLDMVYCGVED